MDEIRILGIVGSLRKGSYNRLALKAAQGLMPSGAVLNLIELQEDLWYDCLDSDKMSTFDVVCQKKYLTDPAMMNLPKVVRLKKFLAGAPPRK